MVTFACPVQRCVRFAQDAASVAHRGKMWRIGGETASVSVYDPIMNQWERGVELPSPRSGLRAVEHCGSIYVFGDGPPLRYADNARRWEAMAFTTFATGLTGMSAARAS